MSETLQQFVDAHPEFFEQVGGYRRLRSDLRGLMERYAHSVNKLEFERMRVLIEEFRAEEQARLESEIASWEAASAEQEGRLRHLTETIDELAQQMRVEEGVLQAERSDQPVVRVRGRCWYHSSVVFWILAFLGMAGIYLAMLQDGSGAFSFALVGVACLSTGVYLQSSEGAEIREAQLPPIRNREAIDLGEKRLRIGRIKRASLVEQKRVAKQEILLLRSKVADNQYNIRLLNE